LSKLILDNEKALFRDDLRENELNDVGSWITPKIRRIFDTGHVIHMLIQYSYLKGIKRPYKVEIPNRTLFKEYMIGGTSDIVVQLQDNDYWDMDIKTANDKSFIKLKEDDWKTISTGYLIQLMIYMYGLRLLKGGIFFWNKNTGDIKEFYFKFTSLNQIKYFIRNELKIAEDARDFILNKSDIKILPECLSQQGKYDKCEYTTVCFRCNTCKDVLKLTKVKTVKELVK